MNVKFKKLLSLVLAVMLAVIPLTVTAGAADAKAVLDFRVSDDGYATVYECDTSAKGVVSIPDKVTIKSKTYSVKYIGDRAFDKCKGVTEIKIPEGVTVIGSAAFRNCTSLTDVYIPESLIRCEFDAFNGCKDVTVHCYTANYQFITLCGTYADIELDIIDEELNADDGTETEEDSLEDFGAIGTFIKALREMIQNILDYFGVEDDEEFSIDDLPFDLPFDIPIEDDSILDDLIGVDL